MNITFVTGSDKKVAEMERILNTSVDRVALDLPEIQSLDLETVVRDKAERAYDAVGKPVMVEDTALVFHALGRLPGTFIKWFLDELGFEGLCALLPPETDRSATVSASIAYHDGETIHVCTGTCEGSIAEHPREGEGFGFDCIFIPEGYDQTWSELPNGVKDGMSHRARAAKKLADFLDEKK